MFYIFCLFLLWSETTKKEEKMLSPGKRLLANSGVTWKTINVALEEAKTTYVILISINTGISYKNFCDLKSFLSTQRTF